MDDENLMVGIETSDDAAVYRLNNDIAIIQTLDFFTPIVDDPYTFGQIAAVNALSDVYAMGGVPKTALNIVCFPSCLPVDVLGEILRGGADKVSETGAVIIGGHTVSDDEPKYGLSVMGMVNPNSIMRNYGSRAGDIVIITKPIGIGIMGTAIKGKVISESAYKKAVRVMTTLNKYAAEIIVKHNITACTDVTGFGLLGHLYEMASASNVTLRIHSKNVPYIKEAEEYVKIGLVPEGCYNNRQYLDGKFEFKNVQEWMQDIMFDPQTSGGLIFTCPEKDSAEIMNELSSLELKSGIIGEVLPKQHDKFLIID